MNRLNVAHEQVVTKDCRVQCDLEGSAKWAQDDCYFTCINDPEHKSMQYSGDQCQIDIKREAGCFCPSKEADDCDCRSGLPVQVTNFNPKPYCHFDYNSQYTCTTNTYANILDCGDDLTREKKCRQHVISRTDLRFVAGHVLCHGHHRTSRLRCHHR